MKTKDFREMSNEELEKKLSALKSELFNLRFSHATGNLANPLLLRNVRKNIARIKTLQKERELKLDIRVGN